MVSVLGKGNIKATIIADSVSSVNGKRVTTYEVEVHRYVWAEFMTHRMFSRNAASSRAIPVSKMLENVRNAPATPIHWGKNQPGMQANEELAGNELQRAKDWWGFAVSDAFHTASQLNDVGGHKQIVNRLTEPFQMMKAVVTATEYENFFWLRDHEAAQPEIRELARCMLEARDKSEPNVLFPGDWHCPYFDKGYWATEAGSGLHFTTESDGQEAFTLDDALIISTARCAAVSYRKTDYPLGKCKEVYSRLFEGDRCHPSPAEHQASPIDFVLNPSREGDFYRNVEQLHYTEGVTHVDKNGNLWSGNFMGFLQHRQLIEDHVKW